MWHFTGAAYRQIAPGRWNSLHISLPPKANKHFIAIETSIFVSSLILILINLMWWVSLEMFHRSMCALFVLELSLCFFLPSRKMPVGVWALLKGERHAWMCWFATDSPPALTTRSEAQPSFQTKRSTFRISGVEREKSESIGTDSEVARSWPLTRVRKKKKSWIKKPHCCFFTTFYKFHGKEKSTSTVLSGSHETLNQLKEKYDNITSKTNSQSFIMHLSQKEKSDFNPEDYRVTYPAAHSLHQDFTEGHLWPLTCMT